jgi:hypothetical protein
LAIHAAAILLVWVGSIDTITLSFFIVYCLIWTVHMPARVLNLILTANDAHHRVPALVVGEHLFNFGCSIVLVTVIGPVGAAVSTLLAIVVSNGIGFPLLARSRLGMGLLPQARAAVLGGMVGIGAVAVGEIAGRVAQQAPWVELAVAGTVSLGVAALGQSIISGRRASPALVADV